MTVVTKDSNDKMLDSEFKTSRSTHTNTSDAYGVSAYGTIVWKDNTWPTPNELISCSGGWSVSAIGSSIIGDRKVKYGRFVATSPLININYCSSDTFSFSAGNITGSQIGMKTYAKVKNSSGKEGTIELICMGSILD